MMPVPYHSTLLGYRYKVASAVAALLTYPVVAVLSVDDCPEDGSPRGEASINVLDTHFSSPNVFSSPVQPIAARCSL